MKNQDLHLSEQKGVDFGQLLNPAEFSVNRMIIILCPLLLFYSTFVTPLGT